MQIKVIFVIEYISTLLYINIRMEGEGVCMQELTVEIEKAAPILKLLGDKTRLAMMKMLETHDYCVCEFVEIFKMFSSNV